MCTRHSNSFQHLVSIYYVTGTVFLLCRTDWFNSYEACELHAVIVSTSQMLKTLNLPPSVPEYEDRPLCTSGHVLLRALVTYYAPGIVLEKRGLASRW